jgi:sugar-specific transcriptional regulator TrmB
MIFDLINCYDILATGLEPLVIPLLIASGTATVVSTVQAGRAARAAGKQQQDIQNRNAQLADQKAEAERLAADFEAIKFETQGEALKERQRALFAKSGVELRGSPLSVIVDTAQNLEADRLSILREGVIRSGTTKQRADIFRAEGSAANARGRAASRASILTATGTALSTAAGVGKAKAKGF